MTNLNQAAQQHDNTRLEGIGDDTAAYESGLSKFMTMVFTYMFLGLLCTAVSAFAIIVGIYNQNDLAISIALNVYPITIFMFLFVFILSFFINKISPAFAFVLFFAYATGMGVTIAIYAIAYSFEVMLVSFGITSLLFGSMALLGAITKENLANMRSLVLFTLIGILISTLLNIFIFKSSAFDIFICGFSILAFMGITMYDVNRLKFVYNNYLIGAKKRSVTKVAINGALALYLDFINILLNLVRLLGRNN